MGKRILLFFSLVVFGFTDHGFTNEAEAANGKSVNIWADPLGLALGAVNLGADVRLGKFTLGPAYTRYKDTGGTVKMRGTGYGGYLRYYFTEAIASSFRLSAFYYTSSVDMEFNLFSGEFDSSVWGALIGYHWVPGMFNLGLDLGIANYSTGSTVTLRNAQGQTSTVITPSYNGTGLAIQGVIGLAF